MIALWILWIDLATFLKLRDTWSYKDSSFNWNWNQWHYPPPNIPPYPLPIVFFCILKTVSRNFSFLPPKFLKFFFAKFSNFFLANISHFERNRLKQNFAKKQKFSHFLELTKCEKMQNFWKTIYPFCWKP